MAQITGTTGVDIINGTQDNGDTILALEDDDLINSSGGFDSIDGGDGFDTLSYDNANLFGGPFAASTEVLYVTFFPLLGSVEKQSSAARGIYNSDSVQNIEKIVGKGNGSQISLNGASADASSLIDLPNNQIILTQATGNQTFNFEKFNNVFGTNNQDKFVGNDNSNRFSGLGGDDLFVANGGVDSFFGGDGTDTADYSALGQAITLQAGALLVTRDGNLFFNVDKGSGTDTITSDVETIVAPAGQANTLVYSSAGAPPLEVDLSQDKLGPFTIKNFVNVSGGFQDDKITGNAANNVLKGEDNNDILVGVDGDDTLEGGAGADTVSGGNGRDRLSGTNAQARGVGELDSLTGGSGRDTFVLGDGGGSFYKGNGSGDFATITDFNLGDRFQLGENESYSVQLSDGKINLFTNTNGASDQVASVQLSGMFQSMAGSSLTALQGQTFGANDALAQSVFGGAEPGNSPDTLLS